MEKHLVVIDVHDAEKQRDFPGRSSGYDSMLQSRASGPNPGQGAPEPARCN